MKCVVQIYMVLGGFHVYKSVFLGWVVGRFNIAVNGEHNCGVPPTEQDIKICFSENSDFQKSMFFKDPHLNEITSTDLFR